MTNSAIMGQSASQLHRQEAEAVGIDWETDAVYCSCCHKKFRALWRAVRHCRSCGKMVCQECSENKIPLSRYGTQDARRVCNICANTQEVLLTTSSDSLESDVKRITGEPFFSLKPKHVFTATIAVHVLYKPTRDSLTSNT